MTTSSFARETTVLETERLHTVPNLDMLATHFMYLCHQQVKLYATLEVIDFRYNRMLIEVVPS